MHITDAPSLRWLQVGSKIAAFLAPLLGPGPHVAKVGHHDMMSPYSNGIAHLPHPSYSLRAARSVSRYPGHPGGFSRYAGAGGAGGHAGGFSRYAGAGGAGGHAGGFSRYAGDGGGGLNGE